MPRLHETIMGKSFFDGKVPRIADALEKIADNLERLAETADRNGGKLDASPQVAVTSKEVDLIKERSNEDWFAPLMLETGFSFPDSQHRQFGGPEMATKPDNRGKEYGEWHCIEFHEEVNPPSSYSEYAYFDCILVKKDDNRFANPSEGDYEMILPREDFKAWASDNT